MADTGHTSDRPRRRLNLFDGFILAGAAVNVIVVVTLVGYWITH